MTVTREIEAEVVLPTNALVGEGPVWDDRTNRLFWVDIMGQQVHVFDPATGQDQAMDVGQPVGAAALRERGGLVLALRDGFAVLDEVPGELRWVARVEADQPANRMNDGKPDPAGRFWAGTMGFTPTPGTGALYRLDPDYTVTRVVPEITLSNGLDWSIDHTRMYYVDSTTQRVDLFDYDVGSGELSNRRTFLEIPKQEGLPDGMTLDAEGGLWLAQHGSGTIRRYLPDGSLDQVVRLPVRMTTCPAFGGPDYGDLYVTSMCFGMSDEAKQAEPLAGALFRCRPGVRGRPPFRFAG